MKNEKQNKSNISNFIKENGFLIALYSVVGVLVVVALSLTFFMPTASDSEKLAQLEESKNVSTNLAKSYKTQVGTPVNTETNVEEVEEKVEPAKTQQPKTDAPIQKTPANDNTTTSMLESAKTTNNLVIFEDEQTLVDAQPSMTFTFDDDDDDSSDYTASGFNGGKSMLWPTDGEVVLGYSPETLVYDATLEQYKTTDSIDIATTKGEDVFAAYDGVVKMVSKSVDQGNYIVIDHGNGWVTTYSQLDDSMKVLVGDKVKKGQQIGFIAEPSTQSVSLGTHLDFKVTKNDKSVNPLEVLE